MNETLTFAPATYPKPSRITGHDVLTDPGAVQMRRYLPVLGVVAAPYAGMGGDQDPLNPLDRAGEWCALLRLIDTVTSLQPESATRLALARLEPPTSAQLGTALATGGPDAFTVVHFVCHGERDMLHLEDENGHEAYAVAEHVARLFKGSSVHLVVMDGCFSHRLAQLLIDETPVNAVTGTRRRVHPENMLVFGASFYAQAAGGASVRTAYRAALGALERQSDPQVDRFELVTRDDRHEITMPLPEARRRASYPLIIESSVRSLGVPALVGFSGRRAELKMMAEDIPAAGVQVLSLHGPAGIGKTWLAAEFVARFGWRFPDGVLWFACNPMTTSAEIVTAVGRLLNLPGHPSPGDVSAALEGRRTLLALDGVDALASWAELERLGLWLRDVPAGNCLILTARDLSNLMPREGESRTQTVHPLVYKAARTLAMRLAVERGVEVLDVDTIDDFLDQTRSWPWLIVRGVGLIEALGIEPALAELAQLDPNAPDPVAAFLKQRLRALATEPDNPLPLLKQAQGLPDAFDDGLASVLGWTPDFVDRLTQVSVLQRDGHLITVPAEVRALLAEWAPVKPDMQAHIDESVLAHLAESWSDATASLNPSDRAHINNLRAVFQRYLRPDIGVDLRVMASILAAAWKSFVMAGLSEEFLAYAQGIRERLPESVELAHLQIAMGEVLDRLPEQEAEAGWALQMTLRLDDLDVSTQARAMHALGQHLVRVDQIEAAEHFLSESLRQLLAQVQRGGITQAAILAHEWANALLLLDRPADAVRRYEAALAGYAEVQSAELSAEAQRDLSKALLELGELDRAEDVLRRALVTADYVGRCDLAGDIRQRLAQIHIERADTEHQVGQPGSEREEWFNAAAYLDDALLNALVCGAERALPEIYLDLGRVMAKLGQLDDAVAHAARSKTLFERSGQPADLAAAAVTLGQLQMVYGDSVAAEAALHEALDLAARLGDDEVLTHAADVLVLVHQIRARRAPGAGLEFRRFTLDQAMSGRARLIDLGLGEHANALGDVILALTR